MADLESLGGGGGDGGGGAALNVSKLAERTWDWVEGRDLVLVPALIGTLWKMRDLPRSSLRPLPALTIYVELVKIGLIFSMSEISFSL